MNGSAVTVGTGLSLSGGVLSSTASGTYTPPTGTGLVSVTGGVQDAAATTVGTGLSLAAGVLSCTVTGGGGNATSATVDFGSTFSSLASVVVTGQAWVTGTSKIVATLAATAAAASDGPIHGFSAMVSDLVAGTGFTLTVFADVDAIGTYTFSCVGV